MDIATALLHLTTLLCTLRSTSGKPELDVGLDFRAIHSLGVAQQRRSLQQTDKRFITRGVFPVTGEPAELQNNLDDSLPVYHNTTRRTAASEAISDSCSVATGPGGAAGANIPPGATANGIDYHTPGQVMHGTVKLYAIYYGSFNSTAKSLIEFFMKNVGSSQWYAINTLYGDTTGFVSASAAFGGAYQVVGTPQGTTIGDGDVETIIENAILSGGLGARNTNAVYFLLTAPNIVETSGFCTAYCGWHSYYYGASSSQIKYAFVGNPEQCYGACASSPTGTLTPNGVKGIDAMISIIAHEFVEATSDPYLDAWYDSSYNENADKCAYVYGPTSKAPNGGAYNVVLGSNSSRKYFLIQENWVNQNGGYCGLALPPVVA